MRAQPLCSPCPGGRLPHGATLETMMDQTGSNSFDAGLAGGMSALAAIVATGSFRRASEHLDVSPPAVTRLISRLEERVGVRLLNRTTRSVSLTDEGRQFYERIAPLLEEMRDAANSVSSSAASRGQSDVGAVRLRPSSRQRYRSACVDGTDGHRI